jgi:hypothetical protein
VVNVDSFNFFLNGIRLFFFKILGDLQINSMGNKGLIRKVNFYAAILAKRVNLEKYNFWNIVKGNIAIRFIKERLIKKALKFRRKSKKFNYRLLKSLRPYGADDTSYKLVVVPALLSYNS